ncbi:MAG TPA: TIGR01777 family oxidoreductase [Gryllotalpicola sp.]
MRVVIGGASGLIGSELARRLEGAGDEVVRLIRGAPSGRGQLRWDPAAGVLDAAGLRGADAVVNLSGAPLGKLPWTRGYRAEILDSRLRATETLVRAIGELRDRGERTPALISGSAVGFYGSRPGEQLSEASAPGGGFLAEVVRRWEQAALAAPEGTRIVLARTGVVLARGGALGPVFALARFGLAGPLGNGRQHWPWISLHDEAAALEHLIRSEVRGPVNLVGPESATAGQIVRAVARGIRRPYWLPAPAFALTAALGDAARELILADQDVRPGVLTETGFAFRDRTVAAAVASLRESSV